MRAWVGQQAPDAVNAITGEALGNVWGGNFAERVKLVEELHADGGGDDLLVGFLNSGQVQGHAEEARRLAEMIGDVQRREQILNMLGGKPGGAVPQGTLVVPGN
jgi:hypothetical protein